MKKSIFILLLLLAALQGQAQFEIKANPIVLIFNSVSLQGEYCFTEDFGIQGDLLILESNFGYLYAIAKYYFHPKQANDRFYIGTYTGPIFGEVYSDEVTYGLGFNFGYKTVSTKNVVFDLGVGGGRTFTKGDVEFAPYFLLSVGYRFPKKSKGKKNP